MLKIVVLLYHLCTMYHKGSKDMELKVHKLHYLNSRHSIDNSIENAIHIPFL